MTDMDRLGVVVKSFNRPECIGRFIDTLEDFYPEMSATIIDDSTIAMPFQETRYAKHEVCILGEKDRGVSYGRNYGIRITDKDFILLCDDDYLITTQTHLSKMLTLFDLHDDIGFVCGAVGDLPDYLEYAGGELFRNGGDILKVGGDSAYSLHQGIRYRFCSLCLIFIMGRREAFNEIPWDEEMKIGEHLDFFLRVQQSRWRIVYTPDVIIEHDHPHTEEAYNYYRYSRHKEYKALSWKKNEIRTEITMRKGRKVEQWIRPHIAVKFLEDGSINPSSRRLFNTAVVDLLPGRLGIVVSTGVGAWDEQGRWLPQKYRVGEKIPVDTDLCEQLWIHGHCYHWLHEGLV